MEIKINLTKKTLYSKTSNSDVIRYLKGVFTNRERFINRFINEIANVNTVIESQIKNGEMEKFDYIKSGDFDVTLFLKELVELYDLVEPFSYAEGFKITDLEFQAMVFGSINITEMITELGHKRIKVEGKQVRHKQFDINGNFLGYKEYDTIYETHEVNGKVLGIDDGIYVIKCWCTSTNEVHWLWIDETHKNEPLEAIASTFRIHESLIPHIKELKRQGDILLVEMDNSNVEAKGDIVPLTSKQYFSLLTAQS